MPLDARYAAQVRLLVQTLPFVAAEECFALKGGTAINLFVRSLPRLSVDIDLAYLPNLPRDQALKEVRAALERIAASVERGLPAVKATVQANRPDELRILVRTAAAQIKVEVSPVLRGTVHPPQPLDVVDEVEEAFGFASIPVVSLPDLYGGKLCAALDRQHPRDLFDVMLMLREEGLTREIFEGFLVYLISHGRPIADLLEPRWKPLEQIFQAEFAGMTREPVTLEQLEAARIALLEAVRQQFTARDAEFLLSLKKGLPDWSLLGLPGIEQLPAVRWKLSNIQGMAEQKRGEALVRLDAVLQRLLDGKL
ncbi:nucleotidyl transferase AbiEii/AbiGii toxin family protein [Geopseudomonas guangdongensis]|uniref:Nucleotidyl transferase AbiEii toxin, Type IV TA system n=1 Tax=Geopseudomonas guangdongensis TaxID=1245526 RepID=A0A1H2HHK5_9GAMM|nr:nucleotidyl transferase AbiEii/AbiGii toxin family protein [Pseudomonas guangdongensis]SDU31219.1 Nucleotidyl transferase AbiEii toxin, Type IV TA system [Pseudomonas guangdongensis]